MEINIFNEFAMNGIFSPAIHRGCPVFWREDFGDVLPRAQKPRLRFGSVFSRQMDLYLDRYRVSAQCHAPVTEATIRDKINSAALNARLSDLEATAPCAQGTVHPMRRKHPTP